ncbi:MAG TPA: sigma-54-dependent Fis family transcriptional regulator, partial [bacterium]|nr:sigma-54-dependent Fis family transcriptional regulator [bacterium]
MKKLLIALTDKEEAIRINNSLEGAGYIPHIVTDQAALMGKIGKGEYAALLLDISIIEESELSIINFIRERDPELYVIIASSQAEIGRAIEIARRDGYPYLMKPVNVSELGYLLDKNRAASPAAREDADYFDTGFIGKSAVIRKIMARARKVAGADSNILITGETGTGKELMARAIYEMSRRSGAPFIAVNSAAIPDSLLESELFGYKKGAFTGAAADKKGLIELADTGTLFLDEIGDLSMNLQAKLLRVLEYGELRRVGDEMLRRVNIRVLAATNQDLGLMMKEKKFREDLFFRLNVIHINIPPLRERMEDVPVLIRYFMEKHNKKQGRDIIGIDRAARVILMNYDYPGNVRELESVILHAFAMVDADIIRVEDLPVHMQNIDPYPRLAAHNSENAAAVETGGGEFSLAAMEKRIITAALERYGSNHTKAAKALGISRSTLWRKMK